MSFTDFTKYIGDTIAKIKNNNELIDELNKRFNPTFIDIMESLQKTNPTLAKMLMIWYNETYTIDESELANLVNKYKVKKKTKRESNHTYATTGGCDGPSWDSNGGCGSSSINAGYYNGGGCGYSGSSRGGC